MKPIYKSKTFWANIAGGVLGWLGENQGVLPAGVTPVILTVGNILLRFLATQPVSVTGH